VNDKNSPARLTRRSALGLLGAVPLLSGGTSAAGATTRRQTGIPALEDTIQEIMNRELFAGARWGMKIQALTTGETITALRADELFPIGSTVKCFFSATVLAELGPDYRFRTRIFRTGPVVGHVLRGDLVVEAGGDVLMGGRVRRDGSLALPDPDHANNLPDAAPLPGNPLQTLLDLAHRVAARGIRRVNGRVRIDTSLFRPGREKIALGELSVPVTPIMVNDNVVDVVATPGPHAGAPAVLTVTPDVGYVRVVNEVRTVTEAATPRLTFVDDVENPDGTRVVRLTGEIAVDREKTFTCYYVQDPVRFAELAFTHALRAAGVRTGTNPRDVARLDGPASGYPRRYLLAEHLSSPVSEAAKVMSNLHSAHWPYLVGAIAGRDPENAKAVGKAMQRTLQEAAGLDPAHTEETRYTPEYYLRFLAYLTRQPYFPHFHELLSVMGRSGSLAGVQVDSPAVGHVFAKAGHTAGQHLGTALAGYLEPPNGRRVTFALYMEKPQLPTDDMDAVWELGTESQGEIVTAVYEAVG
jgi:D-alanyl-D-alanine carboxypeptidase/D-alanyl-D-alanine-endopeptidase (penicillin-binding protein 4)